MGLLCLIAISAIAWNTIQVIDKHRDSESLVSSNKIAERCLQISSQLAYERGYTATILAEKKHPSKLIQQQLERHREDSNALYKTFMEEIQEAISVLDNPVLRQHVAKLNLFREKQLKLRAEIDEQLLTPKEDSKALSQQWIINIRGFIEEIRLLRQIIMAPTNPSDNATYYSLMVKEIFHTFAENMGMQRVIISQAIVSNRSLKQSELNHLLQQENLFQIVEQKLNSVLQSFPPSNDIQIAREQYINSFHIQYTSLYKKILNASKTHQEYPVTAYQWFAQSTKAIDSILYFSRAVDQQISEQVNQVKKNSNLLIVSLFITIVLVTILFIIAYFMIYRRIVNPLKILDEAASKISFGNLHGKIKLNTNDEFSKLGDTFEMMRANLLDDIRQREMVEMELRKLHNAMLHSLNSVVITDAQGLVEYVNPCFEMTSGYNLAELMGKKFNQIRSKSTSNNFISEIWKQISQGKVWEGEIQNMKKNGETFWDMLSIAPVKNAHNIVTHYISTHHDITERKSMENRLNFLAYHDELTGLPNRTLLIDRFAQSRSHAIRSGHKLSLLVLDLDRFKIINDTLGHSTGDMVLIEIANRLQDQARGGETITRYGGDEFVILLADVQNSNTISGASQRILDMISEPIELEGRTLHVTCSLGVAIWPDNGDDLPSLLSHADAAMYKAKQHGRDRFQFFTDELNTQNQARMTMEQDLHQAIKNNEFELYYQPQINITENVMLGAEALIRWNHPEKGLISPADFIPLAEETGLILSIGQWVMDTACYQLQKWQTKGYKDLVISINVSVRQLEEPDFDIALRDILKKSQLDASQLELEITETTMMQDPEYMIKILEQVKQVGVRLALDDFGTGHSSLAYLQRFSFDKLKIDRSFINDVSHSKDAAAIATTIGAMANSLHLEIIAEGVETQQQVDFLEQCGCDQAQGFFYSKPVPEKQFEQLLMLQSATMLDIE